MTRRSSTTQEDETDPAGLDLQHHPRNAAYVDPWSAIHLSSGILAALFFDPMIAFVLMGLWEPVEIFVLSPLAARLLGIRFGHEGLRNSLSDLVFNGIGILIGHHYLGGPLVDLLAGLGWTLP